MVFQPVFNAFATRPITAILKSPSVVNHALLRDQFTVPTWLLFGALIQGAASAFLPYRNIVIVFPAILLVGYKLVSTLLMLFDVIRNPRMKAVIPYRTSPIFPSGKGTQDTPAESPVCAIILGVISNHPLGMLGPGYKEVGDRFTNMIAEMSNDATKHGFLGASAWINAADRMTSSEYMSILYFENEDYLHAYAHGPMHSDTMKWWRDEEKNFKHIGIMHEVFASPKKSWEGVYLNYQPTGLGATTKEVTDANGRKTWVNPLVRANGKLVYSNGRMGRQSGAKGSWEEADSEKFAAYGLETM